MKKISILFLLVILITGCNNQEMNLEQASTIEKNIHSFDLKYPVVQEFDGYFQYTTRDNEKVPLLVHVTYQYKDPDYSKISDTISNLKISFIGVTGELTVTEGFNDRDAFSQIIHMSPQSEPITVSNEAAPGVAYLKKNFGEQVTILEYDDENITYTIEDPIDSLLVALRFTKDEQNDRIVLELEN